MRRVMFLLGLVCFVHPGPVIFWPTLNAFMWPSTWALFGVTRVTARESYRSELFFLGFCVLGLYHTNRSKYMIPLNLLLEQLKNYSTTQELFQ